MPGFGGAGGTDCFALVGGGGVGARGGRGIFGSTSGMGVNSTASPPFIGTAAVGPGGGDEAGPAGGPEAAGGAATGGGGTDGFPMTRGGATLRGGGSAGPSSSGAAGSSSNTCWSVYVGSSSHAVSRCVVRVGSRGGRCSSSVMSPTGFHPCRGGSMRTSKRFGGDRRA